MANDVAMYPINIGANSGIIKNGTAIVSCLRTGVYNSLPSGKISLDSSISNDAMFTKLNSRFDNIAFYNSITNSGNP